MSGDDRALFLAMARGTPPEARGALAELFRRHATDVERFLRRLLGNDPMTEDLTHETFLAAARHADAFRGGNARPWLLTLAARRGTDELRARRRRARRERTSARSESQTVPEPDDLDATLAGLPARERAALELRFVDGLTHEQVAAALGVSLRTAKGWARSGLDRLRARLEGGSDT